MSEAGAALARLPFERPVGTTMLLLALGVLGAVAALRLPLGFIPIVDEPRVTVTVPLPGGQPLEGLEEVARPLEDELARIPGVTRLRAEARADQVRLDVDFAWSADVERKRLEVRDAVARAREALPAGLGPIRVEGRTAGFDGGGAIIQGRLAPGGAALPPWDVLDRHLRRPLERVPGVARVDLYGLDAPRVRVAVDPAALRRHGLDAGALARALEEANVEVDLGVIRDGRERHGVRLAARFDDPAVVRDLPVVPGVRVGDVATVALEAPRLDHGRRLDGRFALGIDVHREDGANTVETVDRALARLAELERDPRLGGLRLLVWQDAGREIRASIGSLRDAGLFGAALAVVVLLVFLRRPGTTALVALAIPFSLLVACCGLLALGAELDILGMLGLMLGVGMLVDNAVVVAEAIHRLEGEGLAPGEAARRGLGEVLLPVVASTATTLVVWSWLLVAERGPLTHYLTGVARTICLAVAASLLVSVTAIPLVAARLPAAAGASHGPGPVMSALAAGYRRLLAWTLRRRLVALAALLALAGSAAWPLARLEASGEPRMRQRQVTIVYRFRDPAPLEARLAAVARVEAWLEARRDELGLESIYSYYAERGTSLTFAYLPQARATEGALAALRERLRGELPRLPGVVVELGERGWWRGRGGDGRRVAVTLTGEDPRYLLELATLVEGRLRAVPGVVEASGPATSGAEEVRVEVEAERARRVGLGPEDVGRAVRFALRGQALRRVRGPTGEREAVLGLPEARRPGPPGAAAGPGDEGAPPPGLGLADLDAMPLPRPAAAGGGTVPLGSAARLVRGRTPEEVEREGRRTSTAVSVELAPGLTTDEGKARVAAALAGLRLPEGYAWGWGDWGRRRDETLATMTRGVALSLVVVVLLMAALFESVAQPLAVVVTLPLAFTGAFWALWAGGHELDAVGFIGLILLVGVVVNNGIVLVDRVNALRAAGVPRVDALLDGCAARLRPVLMTAITTLVGLVPLALSASTVAGVYIDALAVAVIGGLLTSTVFTLLGLPVWYSFVEDVAALAARALPRPATGLRAVGRPVLAGPAGGGP